jgi:phosphatidylethanolamine/phosphatidyl-N-methylethanolamine N-methyltransferase
MKMTNRWNKFIYRLWAPIYDSTVGQLFLPGRKRALELLDLKAGERVLLLGCGTGADLPLLPEGIEAIGVDISPGMLAKARSRLPLPGRKVTLLEGDAQDDPVNETFFDAAILNLILSVVPDGRACLHSGIRALKIGGRAVIFDKFAPEEGGVSSLRRVLNWFSTALGTDITRRFGVMFEGSEAEILREEPGILGGLYRVILLKRKRPLVRNI